MYITHPLLQGRSRQHRDIKNSIRARMHDAINSANRAKNVINNIDLFKDLNVGDVVDELDDDGNVLIVDGSGMPNVWFVVSKEPTSGVVAFSRVISSKKTGLGIMTTSEQGNYNFALNKSVADHYLLTGEQLDPFQVFHNRETRVKAVDAANNKKKIVFNRASERAIFHKLKKLLPIGATIWVRDTSEIGEVSDNYYKGSISQVEEDKEYYYYQVSIHLDDGGFDTLDQDDFDGDHSWEVYVEEPERY